MSNIIGGLIAIVLGAFGLIFWWGDFGEALRGVIPFVLIIVGLISIASKYQKKNNNNESGA